MQRAKFCRLQECDLVSFWSRTQNGYLGMKTWYKGAHKGANKGATERADKEGCYLTRITPSWNPRPWHPLPVCTHEREIIKPNIDSTLLQSASTKHIIVSFGSHGSRMPDQSGCSIAASSLESSRVSCSSISTARAHTKASCTVLVVLLKVSQVYQFILLEASWAKKAQDKPQLVHWGQWMLSASKSLADKSQFLVLCCHTTLMVWTNQKIN